MVAPHYADEAVTLYHGDALEVLRSLPDASVDAVCTDPPYGLEFMGKDWDAPWESRGIGGNTAGLAKVEMSDGANRLPRPSYLGSPNPTCRNCGGCQRGREGRSVRKCNCEAPDFPNAILPRMAAFQQWCEQWAAECLRILKPGGHLLAFGGTRTVHRLTCAIEDAGFEIRDGIDWLYASGFPKSLDVSKAIDKAAGAQREVIGRKADPRYASRGGEASGVPMGNLDARTNGAELWEAAGNLTAPATDDARRWAGWGTALKPAREPIVMARKPLAGTVAANVQQYGTGALNIDACRVAAGQDYRDKCASVVGLDSNRNGDAYGEWAGVRQDSAHAAGRWPANVVLSHSEWCEVCECGARGPHEASDYCYDVQLDCLPGCPVAELDAQSGVLTSGANPTRRSSDKFRDAYGDFKGQAECIPARGADSGGASRFFPVFRYQAKAPTAERPRTADGTAHPTVKPLDLMRWLVRLVTPPGGTVLEPFAGSGTTAEACVLEGFRCIAIEREAAYLPLIVGRLSKPLQPALDIFGDAA